MMLVFEILKFSSLMPRMEESFGTERTVPKKETGEMF